MGFGREETLQPLQMEFRHQPGLGSFPHWRLSPPPHGPFDVRWHGLLIRFETQPESGNSTDKCPNPLLLQLLSKQGSHD
jgi:hypothetical protein